MPGFDGTGPMGMGTRTGGGRGRCAAALNVSGAKPFSGRSFYGRGIGLGFRNCFYATGLPGWIRAQRGIQALGNFTEAMSKEDEIAMLKNQAEFLEQELSAVRIRVNDIENRQKSDNK